MNVKSIAAVVGLSAFVASGAFAQQSGLVNVQLSNVDVARNVARNINVDVSQIPVTVQAPIGIAATVCGIAANVLGQQAPSGNPTCTATSTNAAFDNLVQRNLRRTTNG